MPRRVRRSASIMMKATSMRWSWRSRRRRRCSRIKAVTMETRELYQDIILDHGRKPRNFHKMDHPSHFAHGHNPLCGDRVTVFLDVEGDKIKDVSFEGRGCAISTASASLMTE